MCQLLQILQIKVFYDVSLSLPAISLVLSAPSETHHLIYPSIQHNGYFPWETSVCAATASGKVKIISSLGCIVLPL